jgi:hypothetical protein
MRVADVQEGGGDIVMNISWGVRIDLFGLNADLWKEVPHSLNLVEAMMGRML